MSGILKRRHTVPDSGIILLVRRLKSATASNLPPTLNRFSRTKALESADAKYCEDKFNEICTEPLKSVMEMSGKDSTEQELRLACHFAIAIANDSVVEGADVLQQEQVLPNNSSAVAEKVR